MSWLNLVGTIAVGAVIVLAAVAVFDIVFRSPRAKDLANDKSSQKSDPSAVHGSRAGGGREFKRSNGTDR